MLDDFESAPIDARLKATLRFLRKMTLEPDALTAEDARAVLASGVSKDALREAIHVAYLFNIYDRLADSMNWYLPGPDGYAASGRNLMRRGYLI